MRLKGMLAIGLMFLGIGCNGEETNSAPSESESTPALATARTASAEADQLARAFSAALAAPVVRLKVRDAMRASLLTEHKLVLRDFMTTSAGNALLSAAALSLHTNIAGVKEMIQRLPPLDFYVPARQHRLSWRGEDNLIVAASVTTTAPTTAYAIGGRTVGLKLSAGVLPSKPCSCFNSPSSPVTALARR